MAGKKRFIHYCDRCAADNGLPVQDEKHVKATCSLCDRFIGPLNEVVEDEHIENNISTKPIEVGSYKIERLPNFLPGMKPANIHPNLPYEIKSEDLVLFYPSLEDNSEGRKTFITANPILGEQFRVILPGLRKTNKVGTVVIPD